MIDISLVTYRILWHYDFRPVFVILILMSYF